MKNKNSHIPSNSFAQTLLKWFAQNGRDLPWRATKDPYAIWLSEVILQQTRIVQGWEYWLKFMERFPQVKDLAAATEDEVLRLWQGLGYYSRARNLHQAAQQIVKLGRFPSTFDEIKQLKGVGDYTAAAIASIAFNLPVAVVDGNVYRVLARYFGISTPINSTEGKKEFAALAQSLLPIHAPADFNQAMMDFGAIQCKPVLASSATSPNTLQSLFAPLEGCAVCPLSDTCVAYRTSKVNQLPVKLPKIKVKTRRMIYIYIRCKGYIAIRRRASGDIWQGLWEPFLYKDDVDLPKADVATPPTDIFPDLPGEVSHIASLKHILTHRIIYAHFYLQETDVRPPLPPEYIWIKEPDIDNYAIPRLIEMMLEKLHN